MRDEIRYDENGDATSFSGKGGVSVYAMIVIASGLKLYANHGMRVNRAYTPTAMMRAGRMYLGEAETAGIKSRDYLKMSDALYSAAQAEKIRIAANA
jgi:hypothetical protein